jgi:hypothetical protein
MSILLPLYVYPGAGKWAPLYTAYVPFSQPFLPELPT